MDEKKNAPPRARNWTITIFDVSKDPVFNPVRMGYVVYQREESPTTGRQHYQGYVQYLKATTLKKLQKDFPGAHAEIARGTAEENKAYCTKTETRIRGFIPVEHGTMTKQGERTDLAAVKTLLDKEESKMMDVAEQYFSQFVRYHKSFEKYLHLKHLKSQAYRQVTCTCYWGPTGTGKSYRVWAKHGFNTDELFAVPLGGPNEHVWYDGYNGQKSILLDDYKTQLPIQTLLRILDNYPIQLPVKGSFCAASFTRVFVTSNTHPEDWYNFASASERAALIRRFSAPKGRIVKCKEISGKFRSWIKNPPGGSVGIASSESDNGYESEDGPEEAGLHFTCPTDEE